MKGAILSLLVLFSLSDSTFAARLSEPNRDEIEKRELQPNKNIVEIAVDAPEFSTLVDIVSNLGLVETLSGEGPFTVFAPTNSAFEVLLSGLPKGGLELITESGELEDIVRYHVINGDAVLSTDLVAFEDILTLQGSDIKATSLSPATINYRSEVVAADIVATNGVIHAIDKVMLPRSANLYKNVFEHVYDKPQLGTLKNFILYFSLYKPLVGDGPFTIFAPTNNAFAALISSLPSSGPGSLANLLESGALAEIVKYHVVDGAAALSSTLINGQFFGTLQGEDTNTAIDDGVIKINDSMVISADLLGSNGVIHTIDSVLIPPSILLERTPEPTQNIVEIAVALSEDDDEPEFTTLVELVLKAGLEDTLSSAGPFTVFAPTDAAFAALPEGTLDGLSNEDIIDILTYHVIAGETVLSTDLSVGLTSATVLGQDIIVTLVEPDVVINDSKIVRADVLATNGVIHAIDAVLLPQ